MKKCTYNFMYMSIALILTLAVVKIAAQDDGGTCECVSRQELETELASLREDVDNRVDELYIQLHYWQNITTRIYNDQLSSCSSDPEVECTSVAILDPGILFDINQCIGEIKERLGMLEVIAEGQESMNEQMESLGQCSQEMTGTFHNPAHNCSHIKQEYPNATSGYYWLQNAGYAVKVYCDMERVCECDQGRGAWMRVADIDMTRYKENCPTEDFRRVTPSGTEKTLCGGPGGQGRRCISTSFSSHGIQYSRVCGKIIGYQFGRTNAFSLNQGIDQSYLDGIALTYADPPCHIWSFAASIHQYDTGQSGCPCNNGNSATAPDFVGNDYFCDSGYEINSSPPLTHLLNNPLWDGSGCVNGDCCEFNSPPWFCKDLPEYTTEDIELRLCLDEALSNEDVLIEVVELYVQ